MIKAPPTPMKPADPRGEGARERLLAAALDIFGRNGFDGASTRQIAEAAGVNLQAINYYFGSKQGLYDATADYLVSLVDLQIGEVRQAMRARLAAIAAEGRPPTRAEARAVLGRVTETMLRLFSSEVSSSWVRYMMREQAEPTAAFQRIYEGVMQPMLAMVHRLVAVLIGESDPESECVRLRSLSMLGSILVYRVARATVLRQMGWSDIGEGEADEIAALAGDLVAGLESGVEKRP